jgi:hypothetical protein
MKEKVIVPAMHSLIETIIQYKGFPYYGAERRLDAIISLFLEPIIKTQLYRDDPACIIEFIVPELPIKHSNNQADCVDYILSKRNNGEVSQLLLVELKTDIQSIDRKLYKIALGKYCGGPKRKIH